MIEKKSIYKYDDGAEIKDVQIGGCKIVLFGLLQITFIIVLYEGVK